MKFIELTEANGMRKQIFLNPSTVLSIEEAGSGHGILYNSKVITSIPDNNGKNIVYKVAERQSEVKRIVEEALKEEKEELNSNDSNEK